MNETLDSRIGRLWEIVNYLQRQIDELRYRCDQLEITK